MKYLPILLVLLFAGPALAAEGGLQIIDLPPIDISRGDWWVALLIWFLVRYMNGRKDAAR